MSQGSPALVARGGSSGERSTTAVGPFGGEYSFTTMLGRLSPVQGDSWVGGQQFGTGAAANGGRKAVGGRPEVRRGEGARGRLGRKRRRKEREKKGREMGLGLTQPVQPYNYTQLHQKFTPQINTLIKITFY